MESQLCLRREEEARLSLEREKMQSDRLLQSMSRIVDRYSIVNWTPTATVNCASVSRSIRPDSIRTWSRASPSAMSR